jgi:hypothetical protein
MQFHFPLSHLNLTRTVSLRYAMDSKKRKPIEKFDIFGKNKIEIGLSEQQNRIIFIRVNRWN